MNWMCKMFFTSAQLPLLSRSSHDGTEDHHKTGSPHCPCDGARSGVFGGATIRDIDVIFPLHPMDPKGVG